MNNASSFTDLISAIANALTAAAALAAFVIGYRAIEEQRKNSVLEKQIDTVLQCNERYDEFYRDTFELETELKSEAAPLSDVSTQRVRRMHHRYFGLLATQYQYFKLGMIPDNVYQMWTGVLLSRFASYPRLIEGGGIDVSTAWDEAKQYIQTSNSAFATYVDCVRDLAKETNYQKQEDALKALVANIR